MSLTVHIVCFAIPYPVSHGGFYDLYYKLQALKKAGVAIILHCFEYDRPPHQELNNWCEQVYYYPRKTGIKGFSFRLPYIVSSRINKTLTKRLAADQHPILLEGTHTTYLLYKNFFPDRKILYRLHNIEHIYYQHLYKWEKNLLKKLYYRMESWLLKKYEKKTAPNASAVLTVSEYDRDLFRSYCPDAKTEYLPLFLPFQEISSKTGYGNYVLYHGNLSIAENEQAALWLMNVVATTGIPFIIAGKQPSKRLTKAIAKNKNVRLVADPSDAAMEELIQEAHINLAYSFNATGIKIKLLHALFKGRHCIINHAARSSAALSTCCVVANEPEALRKAILKLKDVPFTTEDMDRRRAVLLQHFNNQQTAAQLIQDLQ